jgi:hypothetical protein
MATFAAVCITAPVRADFYARAATLDIAPLRDGLPERALWIDASFDDAITVAKAASTIAGTTFALIGQSSVDAYVVAEFERGDLVRQLSYNRDYGGWAEPLATSRPWEVDFHFALPLEGFIDRLDEDWTDDDIERARQAHARKDVSLLPRWPAASYSQLTAFAESLGLDLAAGPHARYTRPGLLRRLFGSRAH